MKNKTDNDKVAAVKSMEALSTDLVKIESLISTAVRLVEEGRVVDLAALQERTKQVCDAAVKLPAKDAKPLIPTMESLLKQLDTLTENLTKRYGNLPMLTSQVGSNTAASVYGHTLKHFP